MGVFMKLINSNEIIIKKSRFLGFYYEISSPNEVNSILENLTISYQTTIAVDQSVYSDFLYICAIFKIK